MESLNTVPLSENPLTVAFREASSSNKHSDFLGKLVSSPTLRSDYYAPMYNEKIYCNVNASSNCNQQKSYLGSTIFAQWKFFPDYVCSSSMSSCNSTDHSTAATTTTATSSNNNNTSTSA